MNTIKFIIWIFFAVICSSGIFYNLPNALYHGNQEYTNSNYFSLFKFCFFIVLTIACSAFANKELLKEEKTL